MSDLKYTEEHEWVTVDGDVATIGISNFAQDQLGDVVFVELPERGKQVAKGDEAVVIESAKAASEVCAPVSGEIVDVNDVLGDDPAIINSDATGKGWFIKIRLSDRSEFDGLMDEDAYNKLIAEPG